MKKFFVLIPFVLFGLLASAQKATLTPLKENAATAVKSQGETGTCWNYSATSLLESEQLRKGLGEFNLSEMYTVRGVYINKALNYVGRQGKAQFGEGGLGHDLFNSIAAYGAMPHEAFQGYKGESPNHSGLENQLKSYLDNVIRKKPIAADWLAGYEKLLNEKMGVPPQNFDYKGKSYTAKSFASEVLKFNADDYVSITSFTHHPFYTKFILDIPDNFANGQFYNVPLNELLSITKDAIMKGYTVMWDADVSNADFRHDVGLALLHADAGKRAEFAPDATEKPYSQEIRQELFDRLETQDDHLMHIVGVDKTPGGKTLFKVKNSWGTDNPLKGYIEVSDPYFAINTISIMVPKAAISAEILKKLTL
ncbi:MAG TPA: C1 family peptidase [Pedobacter sp.]|nr:C1 family peptidase [Pedobacter sp.]